MNYPRSESKIISLSIFMFFSVFIFPLEAFKNIVLSNRKLALKVSTVFAFIAMLFASGFLVFQVNKEASERYLISKYEDNLSQALKDGQDLEIKFSKANAVSGAADLAQKLNFEKIGQISYIKLADNKVVKK